MIFSVMFWVGIVMTIASILLLAVMIFRAMKASKLEAERQQIYLQRLIPLNFGALGLAIFGLILIFMALKLG